MKHTGDAMSVPEVFCGQEIPAASTLPLCPPVVPAVVPQDFGSDAAKALYVRCAPSLLLVAVLQG